MLCIAAMVGHAKALSHLKEAVANHARLTCVSDTTELAQLVSQHAQDVLAIDILDAAQPGVRLTVRQAIDQSPAMRVVVTCRLDAASIRAVTQLRGLDIWDVILVHHDSPIMTRRLLLQADPGKLADMLVRRLVCRRAPAWIRPFVDWCLDHDGRARPHVQSLADTRHMRRETLARLCKARAVCPPNHLLSWMIALRARARMDGPQCSLAAIAHELGLSSAGALANLLVRRTRNTPTQLRRRPLSDLAEHAVCEMFGSASVASPRAVAGLTSTETQKSIAQ